MKTGINLFTLRDIDEPLPEILERVADAGYDGVEFLHRLPDADLNEVIKTIDETGIEVPGAHLGPFISLPELEGELDATIEMYDAVGCETLAVSIDKTRLDSRDEIRETAKELNKLAERTAERNIDFLYHNHHWEFKSMGASTRFDLLLDHLNDHVNLEFDVGWAAAGGVDPIKYIHKYENMLEILHVKDANISDKASVEVGQGDVDLPGCIDATQEVGCEWFIYEHDEPTDPIESLRIGARYLDRFR
jgi:sugar phosphate isomerase/epimerase